jgi:FAD/FMN-containing dehydrogenase
VAIGGYLLQGGFGWNSRVNGPACLSVKAIDAVTAAGEVVHASEDEDADLLWAARGAGPGFFAAVTRFHLELHPRPPVTMVSNYLFDVSLLDEVFTWAHAAGPDVARSVEMMLFLLHDPEGSGETRILLNGPAIAGSEEEAREALSILETCPVLDRALLKAEYVEAHVGDLTEASQLLYPDGSRYAVDNLWTAAPIEELLPGLRRIAETLPGAPSHSHMLWMNWGESPERPDMAYSVEDEIYIALYAVWDDAGDDEKVAGWPGARMREMQHVSSGIQLADENLAERPDRFVTDEKMARLDELRAKWDPGGVFWPWMGRP